MNNKIACIFPGQGAQYIGMGEDFYREFPTALSFFEKADTQLGIPLSKLIFEGPSNELTLTKNSQVAIYVVSIAIWNVIKEEFPNITPFVSAGLSLGEYSALTVSGKLSFEEGLDLVRARGLYMHEASTTHPGTMAVILGLKYELVKEVIDSIEGVWIANLNCPGQVVISGTKNGIDQANLLLIRKGAKKTISLDVSGAFHSGLMSEARKKLEQKIKNITLHSPSNFLVMNVKGDLVESENSIRTNLIEQVTSPVLWEKGIKNIEKMGVDLFLEIGCGKTLGGINRKIGVKSPTISINKAEDLKKLYKLKDVEYGTT